MKRIDSFFYGLFMDADILHQSEVVARDPRRAYVDGYALRIGQRATLVPDMGARAYGMVFSLTQDDLDRLYNPPGLEDYRPQALLAQILEGDPRPVVCYILPEKLQADERNEDYAARLQATLERLGFPPDAYCARAG